MRATSTVLRLAPSIRRTSGPRAREMLIRRKTMPPPSAITAKRSSFQGKARKDTFETTRAITSAPAARSSVQRTVPFVLHDFDQSSYPHRRCAELYFAHVGVDPARPGCLFI